MVPHIRIRAVTRGAMRGPAGAKPQGAAALEVCGKVGAMLAALHTLLALLFATAYAGAFARPLSACAEMEALLDLIGQFERDRSWHNGADFGSHLLRRPGYIEKRSETSVERAQRLYIVGSSLLCAVRAPFALGRQCALLQR